MSNATGKTIDLGNVSHTDIVEIRRRNISHVFDVKIGRVLVDDEDAAAVAFTYCHYYTHVQWTGYWENIGEEEMSIIRVQLSFGLFEVKLRAFIKDQADASAKAKRFTDNYPWFAWTGGWETLDENTCKLQLRHHDLGLYYHHDFDGQNNIAY